MVKKQIKLGYEIDTGKEVFILPSHLIVTGITQLSGKTTTLEALIRRSGLKACVFKTKIGEKGFNSEGTEVAPFFRDRSDYEFVKSLIEAYSKEKLFLEKGTLMRLCKGSASLLEIKKRVDDELLTGKLRGLKEEIHTRLQHYLENLIPQIQYANLSKTLNLTEGINIMNLERFSEEAQSLIIQSVADEVLKTMKGVILVIPEAWKFLSQKYNNPCKRVVESFIRQGATNDNFVFIDSQDMAGVDKAPLKQISTWCLTPDNLIRTKEGWKQIIEIKEGEEVLTHRGRFRKVLKTMKRDYLGNIKKIKTYGNYKELKITEEHPVLCEKLYKHGILNKSTTHAVLSTGEKKTYKYCKPIKSASEWIESKNVSKDNLLLVSKIVQNDTAKKLEFELNADLMNLVGWYLAEGFLSKNIVYFALNSNEYDYALGILNSANKFGINGDIQKVKNANCIRIRLFSKKLNEFMFNEFGKLAGNKKIPEWILGINKDLLKVLLISYTLGDGHNLRSNKSRYKISSVSERLLWGIREICTILGYPSSLSIGRKARIEIVNGYKKASNLKTKYILQYDISKERFGNRQAHGRVGIDETYLYLRVKEVSNESYKGEVYNLQVEEDNSYQTISGIVHNCLGYQSERNEVKHTLDEISLPKKMKPKEDEIMGLQKGHFFLSSYEGVKKVYVQPIWMQDEIAIKIAKGKIDVNTIEQSQSLTPISRAIAQQDAPNLQGYSGRVTDIPELKIIKKDMIELRGDFFNKIQEMQEGMNKVYSKIYQLEMSKPVINEQEIISKVLQKLPTPSLSSATPVSIDKESIIKEVLSRVPKSTGANVYEISPLEKIKKDFLKEAKEKILSDISNLSNDAKKTLKYLESRAVGCKTAEIATKGFLLSQGGGGSADRINKSIKELELINVALKDKGGTSFGRLKERIKELLGVHEATEQEVENLYQHIIMELLQ